MWVRSLTLLRKVEVEHFISEMTHKYIALRFWMEMWHLHLLWSWSMWSHCCSSVLWTFQEVVLELLVWSKHMSFWFDLPCQKIRVILLKCCSHKFYYEDWAGKNWWKNQFGLWNFNSRMGWYNRNYTRCWLVHERWLVLM